MSSVVLDIAVYQMLLYKKQLKYPYPARLDYEIFTTGSL